MSSVLPVDAVGSLAPFESSQIRVTTSARPWRTWLLLFLALTCLRSDILWLPPYEDQAVGLWSEANYLVDHHFNYWMLRYEEPHFMDLATGARSYVISITPTIVALLMISMPSISIAAFVAHLLTLGLAAWSMLLFFRLSRPMVGSILAALATVAFTVTPLYSAQIDQVGMEIPLVSFSLWALYWLREKAWYGAVGASFGAFLFKSTGLLVTASITMYLLVFALAILINRSARDGRSLIKPCLFAMAVLALEAGLLSWGDTTFEIRRNAPWAKSVSLAQGVLWCPDFGLLLLLTGVSALILLKHSLVSQRLGESGFDQWLAENGVPVTALFIVGGMVLGMLQYIFIPRYATLAIPVCYLAILSAWQKAELLWARFRWAGFTGLAVMLGVICFHWLNENGRFYPSFADLMEREKPPLTMWHARCCAFTERSREYLQDFASNRDAVHVLEEQPPGTPLFADMPYAWFLTKPRLGYVSKSLSNVVSPRDYANAVDSFKKAVKNESTPSPVFLFAGRSRALFPNPGSYADILYSDTLQPPIVVYQVQRSRLPKEDRALEEWYLDHTWGEDFVGQRAMDRSPFLVRTGRVEQSQRELAVALEKTPPDSFVYPFLKEQAAKIGNNSFPSLRTLP